MPDMERLKAQFAHLCHIDEAQIEDITPLGGMTNCNYLVTLYTPLAFDNQVYQWPFVPVRKWVFRVPGKGSSAFIRRDYEQTHNQQMAAAGLTPPAPFFEVETGLKATPFVPQAQSLTPLSADRYVPEVAQLLATLHQKPVQLQRPLDYEKEWENYVRIMRTHIPVPDYVAQLKTQVQKLWDALQQIGLLSVPCHIDVVPENILSSGDRLYLIDWEYAGMNDPFWDVAMFAYEARLKPAREQVFLETYLRQNPVHDLPTAQRKILCFKALQMALWHVWTLMKEACGDDFGSYGERCLQAHQDLMQQCIQKGIVV